MITTCGAGYANSLDGYLTREDVIWNCSRGAPKACNINHEFILHIY